MKSVIRPAYPLINELNEHAYFPDSHDRVHAEQMNIAAVFSASLMLSCETDGYQLERLDGSLIDGNRFEVYP